MTGKALWIVSWVVRVWLTDPCPDYKPDPYTGKYPRIHCMVNHGHFEDKSMLAKFITEAEADGFISNGPKEIEFKKARSPND